VSSPLRLAALEAIAQLPRWDSEAFVRAIRVPNFRKADDEAFTTEAAIQGKEPHAERWYGAIFFALDDELPAVRAAALHVLRGAAARSELSYSRLLEGCFQRVASIASMCLIDDDAGVRGVAADVMLALMTHRSVMLTVPLKGIKFFKEQVHVGMVVQAFKVDHSVALRVLRGSRFADVYALEEAVSFLLEVVDRTSDPADVVDKEVLDTLVHLGVVHAPMFQPSGCKSCPDLNAKPGQGGRCRGLGHKLYSQALVACTRIGFLEDNAKDMGVGVLHVNSARLDKLRALLRAAASEAPIIRTCIEGLDVPTCLQSPAVDADSSSLVWWAQQLGSCYEQVRSAAEDGGSDAERAMSQLLKSSRDTLVSLHRTCSAAAEAFERGDRDLSGNLHAAAAWAHLFVQVCDVLAMTQEPAAADEQPKRRRVQGKQNEPRRIRGGESTLDGAVVIHVATSLLAHGFQWSDIPQGFPQTLLAFRLLALRLLADIPAYVEDFYAAFGQLGAAAGEARGVLDRPLRCFLPCLPADYFVGLVGPTACVVKFAGKITGVVDGSRPATTVPQGATLSLQHRAPLGGQLQAKIEASAARGLYLRVLPPEPAKELIWPVEASFGLERGRHRLQTCCVPVQLPADSRQSNSRIKLQVVLRVDCCSKDSNGVIDVRRGATGVAPDQPHYRRLNELPLGPAVEVLVRSDEERV